MSATAIIESQDTLQAFFDNLDAFADAPGGVAKLRELILNLAVRGKLVEQDENDEPTAPIVERIAAEKQRLIERKHVRKSKPVGALDESEIPFVAPTGWTWSRLEDLKLDACTGIDRGKASQSHDRQFPYFKMNNMTADGRCDYSNVTRIDASAEEVEKYTLRDGDFLFNTRNSAELVGKTCVFSDAPSSGFLFNNNVLRIDFGNGASSRFANLWFCSPQCRALLDTRKSSTTNVAAIYQGKLMTLPFPLPPLSEQRRIVAKVDSLMSLCDELETRNAECVRLRASANRSCLDHLVTSRSRSDLESAWQRLRDHFEVLYDTPETIADLRQSILQLAVQGKLVPQDPNDEPVVQSVARARKAAGLELLKLNGGNVDEGEFDLPASWVWVTVHDVADHRLGKMLDKAKNTGCARPYLRNTNVHWFHFDLGSVKEMLFKDDELDEFEVRRGDLMICEGGHGIARTAVWEEQLPRVMFQKALHRVRPFSCIESYFLAFCLRVYEATGVLQRYYTGAGIPHFTGKSLAKVLFPLPPLAEQQRIVAKVDQLLSQCDALTERLQRRQATTEQLLAATIHHLLDEASDD